MLGRTTASAACQCCNEPLVDKGVARAREKRQWRLEADSALELNNHPELSQ